MSVKPSDCQDCDRWRELAHKWEKRAMDSAVCNTEMLGVNQHLTHESMKYARALKKACQSLERPGGPSEEEIMEGLLKGDQ